MEKDLVVVKANSLIEASYRLSIDEVRILALTIGTMDPKSNQQVFDFTVADFVREFPEISFDNAYKQIQTAVKRIYERSVKTEDNERVTEFRWVSSRTYFKKEGRFRIVMTNEVMPYLTQLKGQFTQYQLRHIAYFNSVHVIRIYELITQYCSIGNREITVEDLKKWLQVEENYSRWNNFKARVLDPAIIEINEKSDLLIEVEQIKRGRAIHALNFVIGRKKQVVKISDETAKRPAFPHKNKYGKYVTLDRQNPRNSPAEYGNYAKDCLAILNEFYQDISDVTTEDLRNFWVFLSCSQSFRSTLGKRSDFIEELKKRGYKIVECELVKIASKQTDLVDKNALNVTKI
ncbi:replication initiation protein [Caviibacterium pharyngocola]|uniref:RepB family plasmid replication initiator protein n=1 Tax=Caviibacterium pharyngocola TaxID=28159 RepID=A0A2M8RUU7_9PAST|nr:replication initiation protein [Caviibacterium pharyngocola]PJG82639.1 RepB family plasmid replication initiator protein [Caviibacterium pharyngocola]